MPEMEGKRLIGIGLAILGTFLFALKSIFIKFCYLEGASVDSVLLLRMVFAAPFYLGVLWFFKKRGQLGVKIERRQLAGMLGVGFLGYYLASYLDLAGLQYISAQLERLTLFTYPTFIAVLAACFLGERLTRWVVASLILCYLGLWVMYGQELGGAESERVSLGVILVLGSALSYACYVILAKPMIQRHGSRVFTSVAMLGSSFFVLVHTLLSSGVGAFDVSVKVYAYSLALAFLCTVLPSYMITAAIGYIGATKTSVLGTVGPAFTIGLAVMLLGEPFGWGQLVGVILVLIGVALVSFKGKDR